MNTDNINSSSLFSVCVDQCSSVATYVWDFFIGLLGYKQSFVLLASDG